MKSSHWGLLTTIAAFITFTSQAVVRYVDVNGTNATSPFTNWTTAATNIQDAVDVASDGDEIVVTNGVYATGGRAAGSNPTANRVAVDKPVKVLSVNGPQLTQIQGSQAGAIRCVYLTNGASLSGFTLTKGGTRSIPASGYGSEGGGVRCESSTAVVSNCVMVGNTAGYVGGGAYGGTLNRCTLSGNSALGGGGAHSATVNNCTLSRNSADSGGGAGVCSLNACAVYDNSASQGGAADHSTLNNCTLVLNSAGSSGGGTWSCQLNNCIVYFNGSPSGANDDGSTMNYCCTTPDPGSLGNITLDPQLASVTSLSPGSPCLRAGGILYATGVDIDGEAWGIPPSIGCDEYYAGAVTGPITVNIRAAYTNAITNQAAGFTALIEGRASASTWDFGDGTGVTNRLYVMHTWTTPGDYVVVLRAYNESYPDGVSASITVRVGTGRYYVAAGNTNPVPPYSSWATAATNIQDAVDVTAPGSLVLVSNGVYATGGRAVYDIMTNRVAVYKPITVQSVNGPQFTRIQGYRIFSDGAIRCAYLADGASLVGFTLTNGATRGVHSDPNFTQNSGGGVWCESLSAMISNCVVSGNWAYVSGGGVYRGTVYNCRLEENVVGGQSFDGAGGGGGSWGSVLNGCTLNRNSAPSAFGGGANRGVLNYCLVTGNSAWIGGGAASRLNNCILTGNSATSHGGGAWAAGLYNCTVTGNSASDVGGASECNVYNSIVYYNSAATNPDQASGWTVNSCTTGSFFPYVFPFGLGNTTNAPLLAGNLRLQPNSPCINAGRNSLAPNGSDLDGNPRIAGGTVDMGAYEFQTPSSILSYAWAQQYGLPTDGSADYSDPDGDGINNWQEWRADTVPTNSLSVLRLTAVTNIGSGLQITWQSVVTRNYFLQRATNLSDVPPFSTLATGIPGQAGTRTYTDTSAVGIGPFFYRVGVQE